MHASGLVKHYRSRADVVEAVRGVDLSVEAGEIVGFLGPNGAGKSTTVRMLTTLLSITAGTARVGVGMTSAWVLGQRALREAWRTPEALLPTLFIPLFFLADRAEDA